MTVQIYPLNTGFISLDRGAYITGGYGYGQEVKVPTNAFLVVDGGSKILVDTGMADTERAHWHHPGSYQPEGFRIDQRLAALGVLPQEIEAVILTHLHWDHCFNLKLFQQARFFVHQKELDFARDPHILYLKSYESPKLGVEPSFGGVDFQAVNGEHRYRANIVMFPTPGHSPGHQSVEVTTEAGVYVIAGDAMFADENLLPDEKRGLPFTPMGRYVNVFEMYASMEEIVQRGDVVLTAHGHGSLSQTCWP